jgi:lipoate-protein ligase A
MIRPDKDIANEHPFAKKPKVDRIRVADISDKMSIKDINEFIKRYQSGEGVHEVLPPGLTKQELEQLMSLAAKRT